MEAGWHMLLDEYLEFCQLLCEQTLNGNDLQGFESALEKQVESQVGPLAH